MMDEKKISVLYVRHGKYPRLVEINDSLKDMQKLVGGMIEEYMPFEDDAAIICNEEGKINSLPLNRSVKDENDNVIEIIAGDFFIAYAPYDSDSFKDMPDDMAEKYAKMFRYPEKFLFEDNEIKIVQYRPEREKSER